MYPLTVQVNKKRVVVIGGGKVAGFKIIPLLKQGADIVVVSPELDVNLVKLVEEKKIRWYQREYEKSDIKDAFLVVAASSDSILNEQVAEDAAKNQLVNVITNPESGNVHFPAAIHRGLLNIAVSTGGASPKLAKKIRDDIANKYDETYEIYLDFLYEVRVKLKDLQLEKKERHILLQEVLKSAYVQNEGKREQFLQELEERVLKR
ncbi:MULTISPECIES: NAD(P)-binding protein [Bacillus]|jgi:precorrin-2 dehydrogenase/sirohydrochlorin ferrochelatase|uniref:precorrin-2 dehydrogenase n=1 Tax=Bacillus toyonensis TaxID=155322 RepID=A0A1X3MV77_9BACI|nr:MULTISPECIES: NAD(P)-binding protein [Bacillus]AFU12087.1 siroheme synthase precorrin 2 oxidase and ferrochelatase domain protein [Bacillus thuringiensis MC28]OFD05035.1 precorrin-2 dehydrogenase SirC [Bacillus thuringiensis]OTW92905.1 precorrin-2 dehydrogenase [Bacillus thuringiensis serovar cameroun]OTX05820.1 precorrin-2 dehydrogenase [Bacillus thuringiensis serovar seoulensis]PKR92064.1 Transporter yvqF [Bacillus cereus Rock4-18]